MDDALKAAERRYDPSDYGSCAAVLRLRKKAGLGVEDLAVPTCELSMDKAFSVMHKDAIADASPRVVKLHDRHDDFDFPIYAWQNHRAWTFRKALLSAAADPDCSLIAVNSAWRRLPCGMETPIESIKVHPSRVATERGVELILPSLQNRGMLRPIEVTPDMELVDGVYRLEAAKRLGMKAVPTVFVRNLTPEQVRDRLAAADVIRWGYDHNG